MRATAKGLVAVLAAVLTWSGAAVPTFASKTPEPKPISTSPQRSTSAPPVPARLAPSLAIGRGTWQWQNPQPNADPLYAISCVASTTCFASGVDGAIQHTFDGTHWTQQTVLAAAIFGLSCFDASHCTAAGVGTGAAPGGCVAGTTDGVNWGAMQCSTSGKFLLGVSCPSQTACFAVGAGGWIFQNTSPATGWQTHASPTVTDLTGISCPSTTTCMAVGLTGVTIKTTDGGNTWTLVNAGNPGPGDLYAIHCASPTMCMAVGKSGNRNVTFDGGNTWSFSTDSPVNFNGVFCPDTTHCVVVGDDGNAHFWTSQQPFMSVASTGETGSLHGVSCGAQATCFAVGDYAMIVETTNGGTGWSQKTSTGFNLTAVSCSSVSSCFASGFSSAPSLPGEIEATTDGGTTWTNQSLATVASNGHMLLGISCPPGTTVCFAVGAAGTVINTTDAGQHWAAQPSPTPFDLSAISCPSATVCVAAGTSGAVITTSNGGASWSTGTTNTAETLRGVSCPTAGRCFAATSATSPSLSGRVLVSSDGGAHWTLSFNLAADPNGGFPNASFDAINCPSPLSCFAVGDSGAIATTSDGGVTWRTDFQDFPGVLTGVSCLSPTVCFASTTGTTVLRTTNAGLRWDQQFANVFGENWRAITCTSPTTCLAVGARGAIAGTANGGAAWSIVFPVGSTQTVRGLACTDQRNCYGAAHDTLMTTHDGTTWTAQVLTTGDDLIAMSCPSAGTCFAVGWPGAIYGTTDGGTTWIYEPNPLSGADETLTGVSCATALSCVVVGNDGIVLSTPNGGGTWSTEASGTTSFLNAVSCANAYSCVAVGAGGITLARSGGAWHAYASGTTKSLRSVDCPTAPICYAVGAGGTVLKTPDGGGTWSALSSGVSTTTLLLAVRCQTTTVCLAAGTGGVAILTLDGVTWSDDSPQTNNNLFSIGWSDLNVARMGGLGGTLFVNYDVTGACGSVSGGALPNSPQPVGTMVTISAAANGCASPLYEVWMRPPGGSWTLLRGWTWLPDYGWDTSGAAAGSYRFSIWVRDASSSNAYDSFLAFDYVLTVTACTSITVTAAPSATSVQRGQSVLFTASSTGCPNPRYQFWLLPPGGGWTVVQSYSPANTYNWDTFVAPGEYRFSVWVHDASNSNAYDAFSAFPYTITPGTCSSVTTLSSPASTAVVGTQVVIVASATGCPLPYFEYWLRSPGGSWALLKGYPGTNQFLWSTNRLAPGTYRFSVWAQDGTSPSSYQAFSAFDYTLTTTPCTGMGASTSPQSSAPTGTTVAVYGIPSGCPNPAYEFWLLPPSGGWVLVQPYSQQSAFSWNTVGLPAGTYRFSVWARDVSSIAAYDVFSAFDYTLTIPPPCSSVNITENPPSPTTAGTIVIITASALGCPNPQYEFWLLPPGGTWTLVAAWQGFNSVNWYTRGSSPGTYRWSVWARDVSSSAYYEAFNAFDYVVT